MHDDITPIDNIPPEQLRNLRGLFFDLDDTFTTRGKIPACSFSTVGSQECRTYGYCCNREAGWLV